jgi:hypothetical protein
MVFKKIVIQQQFQTNLSQASVETATTGKPHVARPAEDSARLTTIFCAGIGGKLAFEVWPPSIIGLCPSQSLWKS